MVNKRKVKYFYAKCGTELQIKINEFAKNYNIIQISYAYTHTKKEGYQCMVLYEDNE